MNGFVQPNRMPGNWWIVVKGALFAIFLGGLLFCVLPSLAVRFLPLANIAIH